MFRIILSIFVGIRMAVVDMGSHKLRSILSILGVLLGVASLVAMLTLVGGIEVFLNEKMAKWTGSVWFFKRWDTTDLDKYALSRSPGLRYSDGQEVAAASKDVKEVVGVITRGGTALLSGTQVRADFRGTTEHNLALDCESIKIREGRWFSTEEYLRGNRVCCISWEIEDQVKRRTMGDDSLKWRSLVGMRLSNGKEAFTVIGTYEPSDPDFKP